MMLNEQAVSMGPLSDEIIHCETKACTINSELSVRLRDLTMIKVRLLMTLNNVIKSFINSGPEPMSCYL